MLRRYLGVATLALLFSGPVLANGTIPDPDPWESFNRRVFAFNDRLDRYVLKPVAKGYRKITPAFVDDGITNLLNNLNEPVTILNDALQGKFVQSLQDTGRFVVNSTVGVAGFFDVARHARMPRHEEDFGQTFAKWGVPAGPYVVVPFFFGMTIRDGAGYGTEAVYLSSLYEKTLDFGWQENAGVLGLRIVDTRADLIPLEDSLQMAGDRYALLRDAYFQRRAFLINDGAVEEDPFLDDDQSTDPPSTPDATVSPDAGVSDGGADAAPQEPSATTATPDPADTTTPAQAAPAPANDEP